MKQTNDAMELVQTSKDVAFKLLAHDKGLITNKHDVGGKDGKPIETVCKSRIALIPAKAGVELSNRDLPAT